MATLKEIKFIVEQGLIYWNSALTVYLYHPKISKKLFRLTNEQLINQQFEKAEERNIEDIIDHNDRLKLEKLIKKTNRYLHHV